MVIHCMLLQLCIRIEYISTFDTNKTRNMETGGLCTQYGKHVRLQYWTWLKISLHVAHFENIFMWWMWKNYGNGWTPYAAHALKHHQSFLCIYLMQVKMSAKCSKCDYAFLSADVLTAHFKIHSEQVKNMEPVWLCSITGRQFKETFENTQWRKVKQM